MGILDKQQAREKEKEKQKQHILEQQRIENERLKELKELKTATDLSEGEIKYLIKMIANSKFDGLEMQIIYIITAKLQNQLKNKVKWDGKD